MNIVTLPTNRIFPPHGVVDLSKLEKIASGLKNEGWTGRPLMVFEIAEGFQAITGSHRYAAAKKAGVEIPCYVVESVDADDLRGATDDDDLYNLFSEVGDEVAADLMIAELNGK